MDPFDDPAFDATRYINDALSGTSNDSTLDRVKATLMHIQSHAQRVQTELDSLTLSAFQGLPPAMKELDTLTADVRHLRNDLDACHQHAAFDEPDQQEPSLRFLVHVDVVKQRLETCHRTVVEAVSWKRRLLRVDAALGASSSPLQSPRDHAPNFDDAAKALCEAQTAVETLANVSGAELRAGQWHDRRAKFEAMITPRLFEALRARDATRIRSVIACFMRVSGADNVRKHYVRFRCEQLKALLFHHIRRASCTGDAAVVEASDMPTNTTPPTAAEVTTAGKSLVDWLPSYFHALLRHLKSDSQWALQLSPAGTHDTRAESHTDSARFVAEVLTLCLLDVQRFLAPLLASFLDRKEANTLQGVIDVMETAHTFLRHVLPFLPAPSVAAIVDSLLRPFGVYAVDYPGLERRALRAELARIEVGGASYRLVAESLAPRSGDVATTAIHDAIRRCMVLSGGVQAPALVDAVSSFLLQYVQQLSSMLRRLRTRARLQVVEESIDPTTGATVTPTTSQEEDEWQSFQHAFVLLRACTACDDALRAMDASLAEALRDAVPTALAATDAVLQGHRHTSVEALYASMMMQHEVTALTEAKRRLGELVVSLASPNPLLDTPLELMASFTKAVRAFVQDLMTHPITTPLASLPQWDVWASAGPSHADTSTTLRPLPSFSLQPSAYMTDVGEQLMTLMQKLEPLCGDDCKADEGVSYWVAQVARSVEKYLLERVQGIPRLTDFGSRQLAADIEYLANVLHALGVSLNSRVGMVAELCKLSAEALVERQAGPDALPVSSKTDEAIFRCIVQARRISLSL